MKAVLFISFVFSLTTVAQAADSPGQGGLSECISLSTNVVLQSYSTEYPLNPLPTIVISKSDQPPSNGVDIKINVNNVMVYYVIATPNFESKDPQNSPTLVGCKSARISKAYPVHQN